MKKEKKKKKKKKNPNYEKISWEQKKRKQSQIIKEKK